MRDDPKEKSKKVVIDEKNEKTTEVVNSNFEPGADEERPGVGYEILSIGKNN